MPGRIFISYRRADSQYATDRIYDRLSVHFGADSVFMDIDDIPLGVNFRHYIDQQVSTSEIVLAVIGDHWLSSTDPEGNFRLDNPGDFVRLELEAALKQGIKLIPLFIGDVQSIPAHRLPESLRELPMLNATRIRRGTDFEGDIDKLIRGVERIFTQQEATRQRNAAALQELEQFTANIVGQLSGFEALLIQEMRKRAQLEKQALEIEVQIKEALREPGNQLRADVSSLRIQVDALRDEIIELSFQIEERKQANKLKETRIQADADRIAREKAQADWVEKEKSEPDRIAKEKAEAERIATERVEARKIAKEKAEANRIAKEKSEADRIAEEQAKAERLRRQQAAAQNRKAAAAGFRTMLGKVPVWAWGVGLLVILLAAAGVVFGPTLLEQLSVNPPSPTPEPTGISQAANEWHIPAGFLDWADAISRSTPDFIEDFSVYSYKWRYTISPNIIGDSINEAGQLVIQDDPAELRNYEIPVGYGADFQLQFDFTPNIFTSGTLLVISFGANSQEGQSFRLNKDGTWDIQLNSENYNRKLDSGEIAPFSLNETYVIRLTDKAGHIAVQVNGELLTYVENLFHSEGDILIYFQAYKAFEVAFDNILFWDLSDDQYLVGPPEDQAYAFFAPIRQYLFENNPSFKEDFETYQPYWEEMQIYYSPEMPVDLSQAVREGALQLHAAEGVDSGNFRLFFPQISGRAFALQFDFNFLDPMNSGDILSAAVETYWKNSENQEGYSPFCDFYPRGEQLGCGLYKFREGDDLIELVSAGVPYPDIYSPHTLLVIFNNGQYTSFLDGYITAYADGLVFFDQQISINVGTNEDRQKFDVAVDEIKFWNLDGVVYQPDDETGGYQLVQYPILEHLVSTVPTFSENFETPQVYWNEMTVYQDDQQGTSLSEAVADGVVRLDSRPEEMINNYWDLVFPQIQQSANFALNFDVNLAEATRINAFISSASPGPYIFGMGISDGGLEYELHKESGEGDIEAEPQVIISNGMPFNSQSANVWLVSYQSQFAVFVDYIFLGFAEGMDIAENPEIVIFVPVDEEPTIVELDNIQYWNLDDFVLDIDPEEAHFYDLKNFAISELAPSMTDEFESMDQAGDWGIASDGMILSNQIEDGVLVVPDSQDGTRFPINGLFDADDFALSFDLLPFNETPAGMGIIFRASSSADLFYQIKFSLGNQGGMVNGLDGWLYSQSDGSSIRTKDLGTVPLNQERNRIWLIIKDDYFGVEVNGHVLYQDMAINSWGIENYFIRYNGSVLGLDNVKFWNLDSVEIN